MQECDAQQQLVPVGVRAVHVTRQIRSQGPTRLRPGWIPAENTTCTSPGARPHSNAVANNASSNMLMMYMQSHKHIQGLQLAAVQTSLTSLTGGRWSRTLALAALTKDAAKPTRLSFLVFPYQRMVLVVAVLTASSAVAGALLSRIRLRPLKCAKLN